MWVPYAIYADAEIVGLIELAYAPGSRDQYWVYHFFIDRSQQGKGYGKAAFQAFIQLIRELHQIAGSSTWPCIPKTAARNSSTPAWGSSRMGASCGASRCIACRLSVTR